MVGWTIGLLLGCAAPPGPTEPPARASAAYGVVTILSAPWLPPWSGPDTPVEIAERQLRPFCGVEEGLAVDAQVRQCFVDEATAGRPVEFATVATTMEGDPFAVVSGFDPVEGFYYLVDATQDPLGSGTWTVQLCRRIGASADEVFTFEDCRDGGEFG